MEDQLKQAHAYAHSGSVIQDMGYYPFILSAAKEFSNLVHYVRSGDFLLALLQDAGDINGYAFALGRFGDLDLATIATDLNDDIGAGLSQITVRLVPDYGTRRSPQANSRKSAQPPSKITPTSRELVDSMSYIVLAPIRVGNSFSNLSHRKRHLAGNVFTAKNINCCFNLQEIDRCVKLGADEP